MHYACEEECESESDPKPRPKPKPSSADVAERGVASIGVLSSGNLCVEECCVCLLLQYLKLFVWDSE